METWEVIISCLLALFGGIAILVLTDVKEKIRRKQHHVWYEHFDRAKNNAFSIGGKYTKKLDNINMRRKFYQDLYVEGECTEE